MRLFAIGDLHLSGHPPTKPMDVFSDAWKNHWDRIREDWNSRVTEEDTVLLAGDISWAMHLADAMVDLDEIRELPGRKVIIRGNHDYWWESVSKLTRLAGSGNMTYVQDDCITLDDNRIAVCATRGWVCPGDIHFKETDKVPYRRELMRVERALQKAQELQCEHTLLLLHYPPVCNLTDASGFTELLDKYEVPLCVFGHLHGLQPGVVFPHLYHQTMLQLVSADFRDCKLLEIDFNNKGAL